MGDNYLKNKQILSSEISPIRIVDLLLTYDCNSNCPYCFVKSRGKPVSMSPETLDRSIDWMVETAVESVEIVLLGGEPTIEFLLIERAINRARDWTYRVPIKFRFTMTSNALLIEEKLADRLAEWGVNYMISIDGYGERHDKSRPSKNVNSPFSIIKDNIDKLKFYQPNMAARFTVTPKNVNWLREDLGKLYEMGFDYFIVAPATGIDWTDRDLDEYVSQLADFSINRSKNNGHPKPIISPVDDKLQGQGIWGCGAGNGRYSIDPLGNIFACARFAQLEAEKGLKLGDIYNGIDPSGNILKFQDHSYHSRKECISCYLRERCIGGCPSVNLDDTGDIITPSPNECRMNKALAKLKAIVLNGKVM
ncbi:MAG: radical SAM protein [candidate division Zixibacteria bacterium]|nr:radical SAM protein [candidate division Zixibacteria bacterium]